jgi:hypothetical protein
MIKERTMWWDERVALMGEKYLPAFEGKIGGKKTTWKALA